MSKLGKATEKQSADCAALSARMAAIEVELVRIKRELEAVAQTGSSSKRVADLKIATARIGEESAAAKLALSRAAATPPALALVTPAEPTPLALLKLQSQQLTLIKGIDAAAARMLNELGIHEFADIAALTAEDVAEIGRKLGHARRISKEGWIEQATILSKGGETAHARRIRAGQLACVVPAPAGAEVIDLAARRRNRAVKLGSVIGSRIRTAAIATAAAAAVIVAVHATGSGQHVLATLGLNPACASTLSQLWTGCSLALLP